MHNLIHSFRKISAVFACILVLCSSVSVYASEPAPEEPEITESDEPVLDNQASDNQTSDDQASNDQASDKPEDNQDGGGLISWLSKLFASGTAEETALEEESEIPYGEFTNKPFDTSDLYVRKKVESSIQGTEPPEADFHFVVKVGGQFLKNKAYELYDKDGSQIVQYYNTSTQEYKQFAEKPEDTHWVLVEWTTDRNGGFTLKAGQTARFPELGTGSEYDVFEENLPDNFIQTQPPGTAHRTGVVESKGSTAEFVNTWYPETYQEQEFADLEIAKRILLPDGFSIPSDQEFSFKLEIGYVPYANETYYLEDTEGNPLTDDSGTELTGTTDNDGVFKLKGGQTAVFRDIETNVDYTVSETDFPEGWRQTGVTGNQGSVRGPLTHVEFTNASADFAVTKAMEDGTFPDAEFQFELSIGGSPKADAPYYLYDTDGSLLEGEHKTDAKGVFTLKAGQTALFYGINADETYSVKELKIKDYVQTMPENNGVFSGVVQNDSLPEYKFVNRYDGTARVRIHKLNDEEEPQPMTGVKFILKSGGGTAGSPSALFVQDEEGWRFSEWTEGKGTELTTGENGDVIITGLEPGVYTLSEAEAPEGYQKLEDVVFEIKTESGSDHKDLVLAAAMEGRKDADTGIDEDGTLVLTVINSKQKNAADLPTTGGVGRHSVIFLGTIMLLAGCIGRLKIRKKLDE